MPARIEVLQTYRGVALLAAAAFVLFGGLYGAARGVAALKDRLRPTIITRREVRVVHPDEIRGSGTLEERAVREDRERDRESLYEDVVAPYYKDGRLSSILHAERVYQKEGEDSVRLEEFVLWEFSEDGKTARRLRADRGTLDRETGDMEAHGHVRARKYRLPEGAPDLRTTKSE